MKPEDDTSNDGSGGHPEGHVGGHPAGLSWHTNPYLLHHHNSAATRAGDDHQNQQSKDPGDDHPHSEQHQHPQHPQGLDLGLSRAQHDGAQNHGLNLGMRTGGPDSDHGLNLGMRTTPSEDYSQNLVMNLKTEDEPRQGSNPHNPYTQQGTDSHQPQGVNLGMRRQEDDDQVQFPFYNKLP